MVALVKPTKKDSPAVKVGRNSDNKPAEAYAKPHTMKGKSFDINDTPGAGYPDKAKTSGIKIRGTGAATKGVMARGPMA